MKFRSFGFSRPSWGLLVLVVVWNQGLMAQEDPHPSARELEVLIDRLGAESYRDRMAAAKGIVQVGEAQPAVLACNILRESRQNGDPEIRIRCKELVKDIYRTWVVGVGDVELGAEIGWFVQFDGKTMSTLPLVLKVRDGGPADKAGVKPGDAVTHLGDESCRALDGRMRFARLLMKAPVDKPLSIRVKRFRSGDPLKCLDRNTKKTLHVVPEKRTTTKSDEADAEKGFQLWLKSLENRIEDG